MRLIFNPLTGQFDFVGGGAVFDPHSPPAIGDVAPNTVDATALKANAVNAGGAIILTGLVGNDTHFGAIYCGVVPDANNWNIHFDVVNGYTRIRGNAGVVLATPFGSLVYEGTLFKLDNVTIILPTVTVGQLPAPSAIYLGARTNISDNGVVFDGTVVGQVVGGGGGNFAPVYCDGAAWRLG